MTGSGADRGHHDIQRGAAGYSAIVGAFGALAVPAIVLVFATPLPKDVVNARTLATFATGLLVTGMFGSLLAAVVLAYISAERDPIAALAPAIVFAGVPMTISFCSILGAFEVLSALYQPSAKSLFAIIVAAGGLFGVTYSSFAVVHSLALGPTDEAIRQEWLPRQPVQDRESARGAALVLALTSTIPIAIAVSLRVADIHVRPTALTVDSVVGVAFLLIITAPVLAVVRTAPLASAAEQKALRLWELYGANFAMSGFVLLILTSLP